MWSLRVLLLWTLLCLGRVDLMKEFFTWRGSDLLLPIPQHLTLSHADKRRCDSVTWSYQVAPGDHTSNIARQSECKVDSFENQPFSNVQISENGSLIISNVTPENDGVYTVYTYKRGDDFVPVTSYKVHVEVPVSDPVLDVGCLQNGSTEISCRVEKGTDFSIYLTVSTGLEVHNVTSSERIVRVTVPPMPQPDLWNISCHVMNNISQRSTNRTLDACPGRSGWGHLLSPGAVCVLYTTLLVCIVIDLRKMKNEMNRSERRTRRRDQTEMEMEATYDNERK